MSRFIHVRITFFPDPYQNIAFQNELDKRMLPESRINSNDPSWHDTHYIYYGQTVFEYKMIKEIIILLKALTENHTHSGTCMVSMSNLDS